MYKRKFTYTAAEQIKKLPPSVKKSIRFLTDKICENPYLGKSLQRDLSGFYSLKHVRYRIIYSIIDKKNEIVIEYIGLRDSIYELFDAIVKKTEH